MLRILLAGIGIWVGTLAAACPSASIEAAVAYRVTANDLSAPIELSVYAGGEFYIEDCQSLRTAPMLGYFAAPADFLFEMNDIPGTRLDISVVSDCDAQLLILTSWGHWYYDDDDNGNLDPKVVLTRAAPGTYRVWVGSLDGALCEAVLTLNGVQN